MNGLSERVDPPAAGGTPLTPRERQALHTMIETMSRQLQALETELMADVSVPSPMSSSLSDGVDVPELFEDLDWPALRETFIGRVHVSEHPVYVVDRGDGLPAWVVDVANDSFGASPVSGVFVTGETKEDAEGLGNAVAAAPDAFLLLLTAWRIIGRSASCDSQTAEWIDNTRGVFEAAGMGDLLRA